MATEDPTNLLTAFRDSYGRLCHLTCKALYDDEYTEDAIMEAFSGAGGNMAPALYRIRTARVEAFANLKRATEAHGFNAVCDVAKEMRHAHETEWQREIPAMGNAAVAA